MNSKLTAFSKSLFFLIPLVITMIGMFFINIFKPLSLIETIAIFIVLYAIIFALVMVGLLFFAAIISSAIKEAEKQETNNDK